jgi:TatD DNase family protein
MTTKGDKMIIDTHCHLDDERYSDDLDIVIKRAREHNVKGFVIPGADIKDLPRAKEISYRYDDVYYAAGIHPYNLDGFDEETLRSYLEDKRCIAVGECGLDYFRLEKEDKDSIKKQQKKIFEKQIELSFEYNKPLIVHIRDASKDSLDILKSYGEFKQMGILHCFNASEILLELGEKGFYFGIGGVLTFKNAKKLVELLPKIPLEKIVLETDAPYLTPHPHRGERNEPYYTTFVAKKMAELLGLSYNEVCDITTNNAKRVFKEFLG